MITKEEAARQQLETAIRLYFENEDLVSSYTLASASREILDDLCEKNEAAIYAAELARVGDPQKVRMSFRYEFELRIKEGHLKEAKKKINRIPNFLKHADRDHDTTIEDISAEVLGYVIVFTIMNYRLYTGRWTQLMALFFVWWGANNPGCLHDTADDPQFTALLAQAKDLVGGKAHDEQCSVMWETVHRFIPRGQYI